jgi:hypothetical protein
MADCSALQQQLNDLNNQLKDLEGQQEGASPQQKAGIGRAILVVRQKIPAVQAALAKCEAKHGTFFPAYHLTTLLYAPPGEGSEVEYASGSTMGTTTEVTNTFKPGVSVSTGGGFFGNGADVSLAFSVGSKDGISFEVKKERSSSYTLESQIDPVDHSRDTYLIWTNVQVDATLTAGSSDLALELSVRGGGDAMNIISLTGAELKDPTLISDRKKASLVGFTQEDFDRILAMNPFTQSKVPDPNRLRFITTLQLDGPDHPQDPIPGQGIAISDEQANGLISGITTQLNVGVAFDSGIDFGVKATLAFGLTFEWDYESTTNVSTGTKEEATVKLKTGTVGYHDVIDVYQDTVFKTFAFVSHHKAALGLSDRVSGFVLTKRREPAFNKRVEAVALNGATRTAFTNAQGIYRLYDLPDGELRVTVEGETKIVTLLPGKKIELPFELSGSTASPAIKKFIMRALPWIIAGVGVGLAAYFVLNQPWSAVRDRQR